MNQTSTRPEAAPAEADEQEIRETETPATGAQTAGEAAVERQAEEAPPDITPDPEATAATAPKVVKAASKPKKARKRKPKAMPATDPERDQVLTMKAMGNSDEAIALVLDRPVEELRGVFQHQLTHAKEIMGAKASMKLVADAFKTDRKGLREVLEKTGVFAPGEFAARRAPPQVAPKGIIGMPPPGPNGMVKLSFNIGIAGDPLGDDDDDDDDDDPFV